MKIPESQRLRKVLRDKMLEDGILKKNCKKHGDILLEKIRVDVRGTVVCKLCDAESAQKLRDKDRPLHLKKQKEWRQKNPEKMRQYGQNYRPKRHIVARKLYKKWIKIPEQKEKMDKWRKESSKRARENLSDAYVKALIKDFKIGKNGRTEHTYLKGVPISRDVIELKKMQVKLNRYIRKERKKNDSA